MIVRFSNATQEYLLFLLQHQGTASWSSSRSRSIHSRSLVVGALLVLVWTLPASKRVWSVPFPMMSVAITAWLVATKVFLQNFQQPGSLVQWQDSVAWRRWTKVLLSVSCVVVRDGKRNPLSPSVDCERGSCCCGGGSHSTDSCRRWWSFL